QPVGRMGEKITVLMHRAALDQHVAPERGKSFLEAGCAIDNDEFRRLQTSIDQIIEERPPGRLALSTHVLDRQQNFLAVLPDAQRHQKRNRRGLLVEPHPHHCAVENEPDDWLVLQGARVPIVPIALHLAPDAANRVLPHGAAKQSRKRPAHPARVGPGKIGAGDQRVGLFCAALISRNGRVFPLDRLALRCFQTGSRDADRRWPEGSHQLALAMAVPVASPHKRPAAHARFGKPRPFIPVPPKRNVEFRFQEFLDEAANAGPHPGFQGIEPIVPKKKRSFSRFRCSFYGIRFHGVISIGAPTPIRFEQANWRLRHLQIPTTPATAPRQQRYLSEEMADPFKEGCALADGEYGWAKLMGEMVLQAYHRQYGLEGVSCRLFTVYGP